MSCGAHASRFKDALTCDLPMLDWERVSSGPWPAPALAARDMRSTLRVALALLMLPSLLDTCVCGITWRGMGLCADAAVAGGHVARCVGGRWVSKQEQ